MEWRIYAYKSLINIDIVSTSCGLALKSDEICNQVWSINRIGMINGRQYVYE